MLELTSDQVQELATILQDTGMNLGEGLEKLEVSSRLHTKLFTPLASSSYHALLDYIFFCVPCRKWRSVVDFNDYGVYNRCISCLDEEMQQAMQAKWK
jgi:hypothetical protein